jgi:phosphoribosylamine--glycine ligase
MVRLLCSVAAGKLDKNFSIDSRTALTVMLASKGYPGNFEKGKLIEIKSSACDCIIFHAGTAYDGGDMITNGGRVIAVTAFGKTIEDAMVNSYRQIENIHFENKYFRKDIGVDLMELNL